MSGESKLGGHDDHGVVVIIRVMAPRRGPSNSSCWRARQGGRQGHTELWEFRGPAPGTWCPKSGSLRTAGPRLQT